MEVFVMENLEVKDVKLLQYINDNPAFDKAILSEHFDLADHARLEKLISYEYVIDKRNNMPELDKSKYLGLYLITEKGMAFLQDNKIRKEVEKKEFYKKSIYIPIIVSITTTLTISLLKWLLSLI
jgi:hypothetical protein